MDYNSFIKRNIKKYPKSDKLDIFKLLYQDNLLVGHLVNQGKARDYLNNEVINLNSSDDNLLYEFISETVVRVNLIPFLKVFDCDYLIELFVQTSLIESKNKLYQESLNLGLIDYYNMYRNNPPSHSQIYRSNYHPHYRVVASKLLSKELKSIQLQNFIENIRNDKLQIIALEGRCGSGKSTISRLLTDVTIIEMDDHFDSDNHPVNVEYMEKLLSSLKTGEEIIEKCYDCHSGSYYEKKKEVKNVVVVEGVYSFLPKLRKYYDYLAYIVLDKELQIERIKCRSNFNQFIEKWIPREEEYFNKFDFILNADILV